MILSVMEVHVQRHWLRLGLDFSNRCVDQPVFNNFSDLGRGIVIVFNGHPRLDWYKMWRHDLALLLSQEGIFFCDPFSVWPCSRERCMSKRTELALWPQIGQLSSLLLLIESRPYFFLNNRLLRKTTIALNEASWASDLGEFLVIVKNGISRC